MIVIRGAREHNLKNIDLDIPRERLVVITGLSGSGKSSLAFDTIYAEGQRRYMESLSAYARQFLGMMERPDVDHIDGLSPVISIEQKSVSRNPRSTVGTITEVYDFLRLLYARVGVAHSHSTGQPLIRQSSDAIIDSILAFPSDARLLLLAPVVRARKGHYRELFDKIAAQGFSRVRIDGELRDIESGMRVDRYQTHDIEVVVDRLKITPEIRPRVRQSVEIALGIGSGSLIVAMAEEGGEDQFFSRHLYDPATGVSYEEASPNTFSFNSPYGACGECGGLGTKHQFVEELVMPDPELSINKGGIVPLGASRDTWVFDQIRAVSKSKGFSMDTPLGAFSEEMRKILLLGAGDEQFAIQYKYKNRTVNYKHRFNGVLQYLETTYRNTASAKRREWTEAFMRYTNCAECSGGRLKAEGLSYQFHGCTIAELVRMDLDSLLYFFRTLELDDRVWRIAHPIIKEIIERLTFMTDVGVGYLNLDRQARTLSGGESQRIRLATQIGTQLTGVLYVLDEPSIGLHPRDNQRLIASLFHLRDIGNSILVVEHDRTMIEAADFVIDLGPGAGETGGYVVAAAAPQDLVRGANGLESLTAAYLTGARCIPAAEHRRKPNGKALVLEGARGHNLKGDTLTLPLGLFVCVTGVSGSGKSSLINQTLYPILAQRFHNALAPALPYTGMQGLEHVDKVIDIDQSPIGRTPRSNPATYTGLFTHIRDLFALLPEAKIRGYKKGRFSFNVKGGRCEACTGGGLVKLEMNFLPDVYVQCETCNGLRYNAETLEVLYKGKSIADVLDMRVEEALDFFESVPKIHRKLKTLHAVGLGYIRLGQQSTTISGGEAQRVKLSKELSRPGTGDTLYILDEPTTGLHFEDIRHLLEMLQALVDKGNTVLVIEHNMDVVRVADYIIDLGPEGGAAGGYILFAGSPEALAEQDTYTGRILRKELRTLARAMEAG